MRVVRIYLPVHRFSTSYTSGAYLTVNANVGSLIDWVSEKINVIFRELIRNLTVQRSGKHFLTMGNFMMPTDFLGFIQFYNRELRGPVSLLIIDWQY